MHVQKHLQFVGRNEKLLLWCAQMTKCCGGWTKCCANVNSDVRNAPKRLRKTVIIKQLNCFHIKKIKLLYWFWNNMMKVYYRPPICVAISLWVVVSWNFIWGFYNRHRWMGPWTIVTDPFTSLEAAGRRLEWSPWPQLSRALFNSFRFFSNMPHDNNCGHSSLLQ